MSETFLRLSPSYKGEIPDTIAGIDWPQVIGTPDTSRKDAILFMNVLPGDGAQAISFKEVYGKMLDAYVLICNPYLDCPDCLYDFVCDRCNESKLDTNCTKHPSMMDPTHVFYNRSSLRDVLNSLGKVQPDIVMVGTFTMDKQHYTMYDWVLGLWKRLSKGGFLVLEECSNTSEIVLRLFREEGDSIGGHMKYKTHVFLQRGKV